MISRNKYQELTDDELLLLMKEGNKLAFDQIYTKYWRELFGYAFNILNEKQLAEDVIHEIYTYLWLNRNSIEIKFLKSYLFKAVRNKSLSFMNKVNFTDLDVAIIGSLSVMPEIDDLLEEQDLKLAIEEAVDELPQKSRVIFYMSRYQEYSNQEIAQHLNISKRTVENQLSMVVKHVKSSIKKVRFIFLNLFI